MSAMQLPIPGTKYGPCLPSCTHIDCLQTRKDADEPCTICGEPIGYDERCFSNTDGEKNWQHFLCAIRKRDGRPIVRSSHQAPAILNAHFYGPDAKPRKPPAKPIPIW